MKERWLPIVGHEGEYEVSDLGRVRSLARMVRHGRHKHSNSKRYSRARILKGSVGPVGYERVGLGHSDLRYIHRLVLEAFSGDCPPRMECRHLNGNHVDNRIENLRWGTRKENMSDMIRHKRTTSKVSDQIVVKIRNMYESGMYQREIADKFGIDQTTVSSIVLRQTWKHVA